MKFNAIIICPLDTVKKKKHVFTAKKKSKKRDVIIRS